MSIASDGTSDESTVRGADTLGTRRWRLLARLTDEFTQVAGDFQSFADTVASVLTEEVGDGTSVILLDLPGSRSWFVGYSHVDPGRREQAARLFAAMSEGDLREWAEDLSRRPGRTHRTLADANPTAHYARLLLRYAAQTEISDVIYAAIRHRDGAIRGIVTCTRDRDSAAYEQLDSMVVATAADAISLGLDLVTTRTSEQTLSRRWTTAFEVSPIGHILLNVAGRIEAINSAGCEIVGRSAEETIGRHWRILADPADFDEDVDDIAHMFAGTQGMMRTRRVVRPDGAPRWVQRSISLVRDEAGRPDVIHLQFVDVTEQHVAERQAATFVALVNSSPDFVSFSTMDGQVQYVNPAGRTLAGLSPDFDVTQTHVEDYQNPDWHHVFRPSAPGSPSPAFLHGDAELRNLSDGTFIPVSAQVFVLHDTRTGEPVGLGTIQRDIRDRLLAERAIADLAEQRRNLLIELVSAEQAERQRIANEVHDDSIQLLAAAQLRLQLLAGQLERGEIEAAQRATDDIAELTSSAQRQLRQVLLDLEPPHSPQRPIDEALRQTAESFFADTDTEVTVTGTFTDLPNDVASVFYRAGREAVSNARRHANAGRVAVTLSEDSAWWRMTVVDDGVGVPETISVQPGHLGIRGMTSRVEALGGRCVVERAPTGGTRVLLEVPFAGRRPAR